MGWLPISTGACFLKVGVACERYRFDARALCSSISWNIALVELLESCNSNQLEGMALCKPVNCKCMQIVVLGLTHFQH